MYKCHECGMEITPGTTHIKLRDQVAGEQCNVMPAATNPSKSTPGLVMYKCPECGMEITPGTTHTRIRSRVDGMEFCRPMPIPILPDVTKTTPELVEFETGAKRGSSVEDEPYHLLSPIAQRREAHAAAEGRDKYGRWNYLKGIPAENLWDHLIKHLHAIQMGDTSEDHLGHARWNLSMLIHFSETRPDLFKEFHPDMQAACLNFGTEKVDTEIS